MQAISTEDSLLAEGGEATKTEVTHGARGNAKINRSLPLPAMRHCALDSAMQHEV